VVVALAARVEALRGVIPAAMQWLPGGTEVLGWRRYRSVRLAGCDTAGRTFSRRHWSGVRPDQRVKAWMKALASA
jgi:hypothetical protein